MAGISTYKNICPTKSPALEIQHVTISPKSAGDEKYCITMTQQQNLYISYKGF